MQSYFLCIDLKSYFASVECVERGLDPMQAKLVVADPERSQGTICLAVSPALKKLGVKNRCRVYEIPDSIKYIMAPPRMQLYIDYASIIYGIYLKYIDKEDIHVYSIDEAFMDVTQYLKLYKMTARELGQTIMNDILETTGIRATCGVGTNLYLAKIALDIMAKHAEDYIGELNEEEYCSKLWNHKPLTDFWRIGYGVQRKLAQYGILTMYDIAHTDEDFLYRLFGIDAELLIDHSWGREPVTMKDIKTYRPAVHTLSRGQVLLRDYSTSEAELIVKEMVDNLCLEMVDQQLITQSVSLYVGYSHIYEVGSSHDTITLPVNTNSCQIMTPELVKLYRRIVKYGYPVRRINICCNKVQHEEYIQQNFMINADYQEKERKAQVAVNTIKKRFGKNAILKGMNLYKEGTARARNAQIGGHKA